MAIVEIKSGGTYSGGYSGASTVKYYARNLCRLFTFSMFVSGLSQVQTFLAKIYAKVSGSAISSSLKNMIVTILIKEKLNNWKLGNLKGAVATINLNFNVLSHIGSLKKVATVVKSNFDMFKTMSIIKKMSSNFKLQAYGEADITVARYHPISDFSTNTLDDLLGRTLEEMIYIVEI